MLSSPQILTFLPFVYTIPYYVNMILQVVTSPMTRSKRDVYSPVIGSKMDMRLPVTRSKMGCVRDR
jgi:hypothetical protein